MEEKKPQIETGKFEIEKDVKEALKIYFMIARPQDIKIPEEAVAAVLAYNLDDALTKVKIDNPAKRIVYFGQNVTIKELLDRLYLEGGQIIPLPSQIVEEIPQEITKEKLGLEQFKAGLVLAMNDLIKEENDKQVLKEIIRKL